MSVCVCVQEVAKRREVIRFRESLEPAHSNHNLRYSVYLLYWYKRTSTDAGVRGCGWNSAGVAATLGITRAPLRVDSQVKYALMARGDAVMR